jgi:Domain of unknown function (DUF4900)
MKNSRKTSGVTLVFTVLIVMLLLAGVVVITGQLAVSARRSSADQQATVQAQYVAESGVARAQARLNLVGKLMASGLQPNADVKTSKMLTWMQSLCAGTAITGATSSFANPAALCSQASPNDVLSGVAGLATSGNLAFFTENVKDTAYAENGYPLGSDTEATFWAQSLQPKGVSISADIGEAGTGSVQGQSGLALNKVERFGPDSYRLTFTIPDVVSTSTVTGGGRRLTVRGVTSEYTYEISRGSFAKYALFTNHHFANSTSEANCAVDAANCSRVTFTSNTLFSGPVHTNQNYLVQGTPYFAGQITSAGCPPGHIKPTTDSDGQPTETCDAPVTPGAFFKSNTLVSPSGMQPNPTAPVACASGGTPCPAADLINPQFQGGVNWTENFQPLPKNANNQATAAVNGGLSLSGNVDSLYLAAGSITPSGSGSASPAQLITYGQGGTITELAVTEDKKVYIKVGGVWVLAAQVSGTWISAASPAAAGAPQVPFNGVIYANGTINSLKGPARTTANDPATAPAALTNFSQITVAATSDIHIKGDLKYADPPCSGSNSVAGGTFSAAPCPNTASKNILGIYSSGGDVDIDSPAKYGVANGVGKDVTIQGVLMASTGRVTVDGYDAGTADGSLGQVKLLGGIIENYYGPFGITDGRGFGRNYVYDPRTGDGLAPPSFPTQQKWETAFKKTVTAGGASIPSPLKLELEGSETQQQIQ